nr:unnamed protein product [Callosobruchus analis]
MDEILQVGSSINIKRTDGRIHSAIVAAINNDTRCATVEWYEQGETKGKEIDLNTIGSLNPEIVIMKPGEHYNIGEKTVAPPTEFNKLQRDPSGSSEEETSAMMGQSGRFTQKIDESDDDFNSNQFSSETATISVKTLKLCVCRLTSMQAFMNRSTQFIQTDFYRYLS